jgi:hypothetical protein
LVPVRVPDLRNRHFVGDHTPLTRLSTKSNKHSSGRFMAALARKLRAMRRSLPGRDQLLLGIGAAKKEAGRAFGFVTIAVPAATEAVTQTSFHFGVDKIKLRQAEQRDAVTCGGRISLPRIRRCCGPAISS